MTRPSDIIVICHPWVNLDGKFAVKIDVFPLNKYSILTSSRSSDQPSQPKMVSVKHKIDKLVFESSIKIRSTQERVLSACFSIELLLKMLSLLALDTGIAVMNNIVDRSLKISLLVISKVQKSTQDVAKLD